MGTANYAGCPWENYDSTDKNCCDGGDGDGDGDCAPVNRTFVTSVTFDSLARMLLGNLATPLPIAWPDTASSPQTLAQWTTQIAMGSSSADPVAGKINTGLDTGFEATLNIDIEKTTTGPSDLKVAILADFGPGGIVTLEDWTFGIGGSGPDELIGLSFTTLVPAASGGPPGSVDPDVYVELSRPGGLQNSIQVNKATFYVKQCLPIVESVTIDNCESGGDGDCPNPITAVASPPLGVDVPLTIGTGPGSRAPWPPPTWGQVWQLTVGMGAAFDPSDYTVEVLINGVPTTLGTPPLFATVGAAPAGPPGTQTQWIVTVTVPGADNQAVDFRWTKNSDPGCTFTQGFGKTDLA